ncbi:MAG: hypothetical protein IM638_14270 [Bacteroidetes bacterium]|nr:hypothetical protein [Bacteroidota bacterium]
MSFSIIPEIRYFARMETPVNTENFFMLNLLILLLFIFLAAAAGVIALLYGRVVYKRWFSWVRLFGGAMLGGLLASGVIWFASEFGKLDENNSLAGFNDMMVMICALFLPLMLIIPLLSIAQRNRKAKIAELELEVAALKAQLASKGQSQTPPSPPPAATV